MKRFAQKMIALGELVQSLLPFVFAGDAIQVFAMFRYFDTGTPLAYRILQFGFYIAVCALTFVAGVLLWRSKPLGLKLSALAQILQIPIVTTTAFSYAVKLSFGIWIFCNFDTGFVGFTATAYGNSELALIFNGLHVAPVIEINVLAVCILVWLLRAMRRERPGYVEKPKAPLPRRVLRFALKALLVLFALVLVPLVTLWIYNRFDEAPTEAAEHWFAPMPHTVPDAENAWLYMLGFHAADNDDPIVLGRKRLNAYEARMMQRQELPISAEEQALKPNPLAFQQNDAQGNKVEFCEPEDHDCLDWAKGAADRLTELERANALLLRRYDDLLGMQRIDELSTPSSDDPQPDTSKEAALYRSLILRDLANPATRADALRRIVRVVAFWQNAEAPAPNLIVKVLAERTRERYMRVLDGLVNQSGAKGLDSLHDVIDVVLRAPTAAQREWEPLQHRQALQFRTVLDKEMFAGPIDAFRYCQSHCLRGWLIAQLFAPQATRNLFARLWDATLEENDADPRNIADAKAHYAQILASATPLNDSAKEMLRRMTYNLSGKVVTTTAMPDYSDYLYMQHDTEALRRMLLLKVSALKERTPAQKMPEFLAQQRDTLCDPYTGEAFIWDNAAHEIRFVPKSKRWKKDFFAVSYASRS
jgi:hypothetical protein